MHKKSPWPPSGAIRSLVLRVAAALAAVMSVPMTSIAAVAQQATDASRPMEFRIGLSGGNCLDCVWLQASGTITSDTPERLRERLQGMKQPIVVLNSLGGDLRAGLGIGMILRDARAHTIVGETEGPPNGQTIEQGICASACAYAFLGGVERSIEPGSRYGLHQFYDSRALLKSGLATYSSADVQRVQALVGLLVLYAHELSIDPTIIHLASRTSPAEVRWLSTDELVALRVVTPENSPGQWAIRPVSDGAALVASVSFRHRTKPTQHVSVYCRRNTPKVAAFQIAASIAEQVERMGIRSAADLSKLISEISIEEELGARSTFKISRKPVRVHLNRNIATVEMEVSSEEVESLLKQGTLKIEVGLPHVFGEADLYAIMDVEAGRSHIRAALRNCL